MVPPVDRILTEQLAACREWLRDGRDFAVTFVVVSCEIGGHWCTWVRLSPPPIGPELGIVQVLVDWDSGVDDTTLIVGRPIGHRPGAALLTMAVDCFENTYVSPDPDPIEYLVSRPRIVRRDPAVREPKRKYDARPARELCARYHGAFLRREEDGIWRFLVPL